MCSGQLRGLTKRFAQAKKRVSDAVDSQRKYSAKRYRHDVTHDSGDDGSMTAFNDEDHSGSNGHSRVCVFVCVKVNANSVGLQKCQLGMNRGVH